MSARAPTRMRDWPTAATGTVIDGKYEILKQIGQGGTSRVYLAEDIRLGKYWAVKAMQTADAGSDSAKKAGGLRSEAQIMKNLDHPALPRIVDIIDEGQTRYIVMDYIEGETLEQLIRRCGPQPEETVLEWARQICAALSYLHRQTPPIIYRDMKPANVMLKAGHIKIVDFGIAREYKATHRADTTEFGTRGYASPEHYGSGQTDARSDIYTLGMTIHYLLTGVDPTKESYRYLPLRRHNPALSKGIERIVEKCAAINPVLRYQTMDELLLDLEHPTLRINKAARIRRRRLGIFLFLLCACIGLLFAGTGCRVGAEYLNRRAYQRLISVVSATSFEQKIAAYRQAISLYPARLEAYVKLVEAYEEEGIFGKEQNDEFLALYNANKSSFDTKSASLAELNYRIGVLYFLCYTDEDGTYRFSERVQKAYAFFALNEELTDEDGTFAQEKLSGCYYAICSFYKTYVLQTAQTKEVTDEEFGELLFLLADTVDDMEEEGAYEQLALYNGIVMLLYDIRQELADEKVNQETVLDLFDRVCRQAEALTVQKEMSLRLKEEIAQHKADYRAAIIRAYEGT